MTTDMIADMLTRIRNAIGAGHETVSIPASKVKENIANILLTEGYINKFEAVEENGRKNIVITLKYNGKENVISGLKRISKPGLRIYAKCDELPRVLNGLGIAIISTSKGLLTDKEAREKKLGGEVLAYVW